MGCEYFQGDRLCVCRAVGGSLTPSLHERERYCLPDGAAARCPTYRLRSLRTEALPQEVYYALWFPLLGDDKHGEVNPSVP